MNIFVDLIARKKMRLWHVNRSHFERRPLWQKIVFLHVSEKNVEKNYHDFPID